jgi:hypothetical protein
VFHRGPGAPSWARPVRLALPPSGRLLGDVAAPAVDAATLVIAVIPCCSVGPVDPTHGCSEWAVSQLSAPEHILGSATSGTAPTAAGSPGRVVASTLAWFAALDTALQQDGSDIAEVQDFHERYLLTRRSMMSTTAGS